MIGSGPPVDRSEPIVGRDEPSHTEVTASVGLPPGPLPSQKTPEVRYFLPFPLDLPAPPFAADGVLTGAGVLLAAGALFLPITGAVA